MAMDADKKIVIGFKTIILGLCFYIIELLSLPIFAALQKALVGSFYSDYWKYTGVQPYPAIFVLTGLLVVLGIAFMAFGCIEKRK